MIVRYSKEGDLLGFLRKLGLGGPEATPALRRKMEELIEDTPTSFIPLLQEDYSAFRARAILQQLSTEKPLEITPFVRQCVELSAEELVTSLDTAQEHAGKRYFVVDCRPKSYFERWVLFISSIVLIALVQSLQENRSGPAYTWIQRSSDFGTLSRSVL